MSDIAMPEGVTPVAPTINNDVDQSLEAVSGLLSELGGDMGAVLSNINKQTKNNEKLSDTVEEQSSKTSEFLKKSFDQFSQKATEALKSPFALITEPFEELLGLDLAGLFSSGFSDIKDKFSDIFISKEGKKNPTENDLVKAGKEGLGFLYLGNLFEDIFGKKERDEEGGGNLLSDILGTLGVGGVATTLSQVLPSGPVAGLAVGLIWMAIDGIKGYMMAEEWGVSKVSGAVGGALGGTDSGIKGAFKNAGKWAVLGATLGSVVPVVGTIAGGLLGAAVGGILGAIGGERIAKFVDLIGTRSKEYWGQIKDSFRETFLDEKDSEGKVVKKGVITKMKESLLSMGESVGEFFTKVFEKIRNMPAAVGEVFNKVKEKISGMYDTISEPIKNFFDKIKLEVQSFIADPGAWIKEKWSAVVGVLTGFFDTIKMEISAFIADPGEWIREKWKIITEAIGNFFTNIFEGIADILEAPKEWLKKQFTRTQEDEDEARELATGQFGGFYRGAPVPPEPEPSTSIELDDGIITKTGDIIHTDPDDNIIATKNDPTHVSMGTDNKMMEALIATINKLSDRIDHLEPKLVTIVNKGVTADRSELYSF